MSSEERQLRIQAVGARALMEDLNIHRRRHHRVPRRQLGPLSAWLVDDRGFEHVAQVVDISASGAALTLAAPVARRLEQEQPVQLLFLAPTAQDRFRVTARPVGSENQGARTVVRFSFEPLLFADLKVPALLRVFNRRRSPRFEPSPTELPLEVELLVGEGEDEGDRVIPLDISSRGLGVAGSHLELLEGDAVVVRLTLPGASEPIQLNGTVRSRVERADGVRLGLEFEKRALTSSYVPARRLLAEYLAARMED